MSDRSKNHHLSPYSSILLQIFFTISNMKMIKNAKGMWKTIENTIFVDGSRANIEKILNKSVYASRETLQYINQVNISANIVPFSSIFFLINQRAYITKLKRLIKTIKKVNFIASKIVNTIYNIGYN